jgi:hypothetical protein
MRKTYDAIAEPVHNAAWETMAKSTARKHERETMKHEEISALKRAGCPRLDEVKWLRW